ncbi:glutathione S-transferase [Tateyamaria sp. ANG-S1]|uniref:glutathione S-transferase family protein n=1 Tax=Tateyamaria sp. ANG-S1 TaxID=1577905 RepID=UPI00057CF63D|nr:glutathione S-transferase [Tateyamaria sp. ANG-S1]KIC49920.1 glutathione S-transferase [Tateyamaria sp. ANG-S1]
MYRVIGTVKSRAFRVLWVLEELGQPYELVEAGPRSDVAREFNPLGKIPALVDGDAVLTDSVAIMTYLADKHGGLTAPAGTPERAKQDAMTLWLIDEMDALLWTASKHAFVLPEKLRVPDVVPTLHKEFARNAEALAGMLEQSGDFLMGDKITLPDLLAVHCLGWAFGAEFPPLPEPVKAYSRRLRARPAFRAAAAA